MGMVRVLSNIPKLTPAIQKRATFDEYDGVIGWIVRGEPFSVESAE